METQEKEEFGKRLEETQAHIVDIEKKRIVEKSRQEIARNQVDKVPNKTKALV